MLNRDTGPTSGKKRSNSEAGLFKAPAAKKQKMTAAEKEAAKKEKAVARAAAKKRDAEKKKQWKIATAGGEEKLKETEVLSFNLYS